MFAWDQQSQSDAPDQQFVEHGLPAVPHVLIIGGGFGGLSAARRLRAANVQVTLLDRRNHHVFQPLLYQVATATLSPGDIASPIRWILRRQHNLRVLLGEADSIDVARRRVTLADGATMDYDYLILAPGARHTYFGHDGWAGAAPGLKTLEDALEIRRRVLLAFEWAERESDAAEQQKLLTFAIVGGGPTGVELAGTLAEIARHTLRGEFRSVDTSRTRIVLIEAGPTILATFPEKLRTAARKSLARLGVAIRERTAVTAVDAHGVTLATGERVDARTVVWAAGVAASPITRTLNVPLDRSGRVVVNKDLSVPGHPEVFVVGDAASFTHQGGVPLPGVAQVAIQGAAHAAANILRKTAGAATEPFQYHDKGNMAIIGRGSAVAVLGHLQIAGFAAWCLWLFVHIFQLIGFRNRLVVMIQWAAAYMTFQRSVRLITNRNDSSRLES
ncbi:MAG: FAD-dependent oxidoreductase [Acidobacteria bacterium]|nr:MAG: FAD-dependent oxidoreductase [Acidobacteriota bacterium]PYR45997.1 MAG: FAD-dependent oxidoreductase [Acidobacteriota bacterium]